MRKIPPCSVSDGSAANSAACACGSVDCESPSTTGMFCRQSENRCRKGINCTNTDGSVANSAACACGSVDCESADSTGMHCYLSKNQCRKIPACSVSDGSAANSAACACGSVDCESADSTGMHCYLSKNQCRKIGCEVSDGSCCQLCSLCGAAAWTASLPAPLACTAGSPRISAASSTPACRVRRILANSQACACGRVDCESASTTGMFCRQSENRCSKYAPCNMTDGSTANPSACGRAMHLRRLRFMCLAPQACFASSQRTAAARLLHAQCPMGLPPTLACVCGSMKCESADSTGCFAGSQRTDAASMLHVLYLTDPRPTLQPVLAAAWTASLPAPLACTAT